MRRPPAAMCCHRYAIENRNQSDVLSLAYATGYDGRDAHTLLTDAQILRKDNSPQHQRLDRPPRLSGQMLLSEQTLEPLGIESEDWGGAGKSWKLPPRDLGSLRKFGWLIVIPFVIAIPFVVSFLGFFYSVLSSLGKQNEEPIEWVMVIVAGVLSLVFLMGAWQFLKLTSAARAVLNQKSYSRLMLDETKLVATEHLGLLKWKRKFLAPKTIERLLIVSVAEWIKLRGVRDKSGAKEITLPFPESAQYSLLAISPSPNKPTPIAIAYSLPVLQALQADVAKVLQLPNDAVVTRGDSPMLEGALLKAGLVGNTGQGAGQSLSEELPITQPSGSTVVVTRREDGVTFQIPKQGLATARGLLLFAILWMGFSAVIGVGILYSIISEGKGIGEILVPALFVSFFELVGVGLLLGGIYQATCTSTVATSHGMLFVSTTSIFGKKTRQWEEEEISTIECMPSGTRVNDRPIMHLEIVGHDGKCFGALSQLTTEEIEWIAYELRKCLNILSLDEQDEEM